ncbi:MAG TPA: acyl-CoA dehydrogenase family protein [Mycobacteriales bacterium]|nr:acyl-CoA dehydrogenase family protein [Mycobacteriales bacterium]
MTAAPDLAAARTALDLASGLITAALRNLGAGGGADAHQTIAYDLAHAAAAVEGARSALLYGEHGETEARIACAFVADAIHDLVSRLIGRDTAWGVDPATLAPAHEFLTRYRDPAFVASLAGAPGDRHLENDFVMVQDAFRRFAEEKVRPVAERVHRDNDDIPEDVISGLAELGTFGLSIPAEYGGFSEGGESEYMAMVVATEELSRASLGAAGSLITRPEILSRALVQGGTEKQKQEWLPRLASGEIMNAVAVTEPDFGSDAGAVRMTATRAADGSAYVLTGVKTWCTFAARADILMLLARTDPDTSKGHKGLSLFIVPKERGDGHGFEFTDGNGGTMSGRPIDTIGYRGMHSYEVAFDSWVVPAENLIGEEAGLGRGFYMTLQGFENGRLQTAARAVGVMQAAYEAAYSYAQSRVVFGSPILDYELTQVKLGRMAVIIQSARQFMYDVAKLMASGESATEASMVKAYVCRAAEWVTREAMQIHGGMGYAEEFPVSRYFVDARVLSIFEGTDETLTLKVITKRLIDRAAKDGQGT